MKKKLTQYVHIVKRHPVITGAVALVLIIILFSVFGGNGDEEREVMTVTAGDFVQQVSVSGKVVAAQEVDLTFPETGRVEQITVKVGDRVFAGQTLASLSMGTLTSDLRSAQASLALRKAERENAAVNLTEVENEQDGLVQSAYRKLLSTDLAAVPRSSSYNVTAPVISGLYQGEEGEYEFRIKRGVNANQYELYVFGLERTEKIDLLKNEATPLGTKGLYLSFPEELGEYVDTNWTVSIPNVRAASYAANYNAYQQALQTRDRVVGDAEALLRSGGGTAVLDAQIQQAEADVARINASISERTIRAPFSGVVTVVDIKTGAAVSLNTPAISLMALDTLQVESYVPEIHVSLVKLLDKAEITLDAYAEAPFMAEVVAIDPAETIKDGVSMYRTILAFTEEDERVKAGMTANVTITTEEKQNVISIPQGAVEIKDGKRMVRVLVDEEVVDREVTVGSVSSSGSIEILTGLSEGDVVVVSPR